MRVEGVEMVSPSRVPELSDDALLATAKAYKRRLDTLYADGLTNLVLLGGYYGIAGEMKARGINDRD